MDMDGKYYNLILESLRQQSRSSFFDNIIGTRATSEAWAAWIRLTKDKYVEFRNSLIEYLNTNFVIKWPARCVGSFMRDAFFNDWFLNIFSGIERHDVEDGYVPWPSNYPNRLTFHQFCRENGAICCFAFKVVKQPNPESIYDEISCCRENTRLFYKNNGETEILKYFWEPHDCQSGAFSRIKIVIPELSTSATHFIGGLRKQIRDAFRKTFSIGMPDEQFQNYFEVDPAEDAVRIKHGEWVKKIGVKFLNRGGNLDGHHVLRECYIDVGDVIN